MLLKAEKGGQWEWTKEGRGLNRPSIRLPTVSCKPTPPWWNKYFDARCKTGNDKKHVFTLECESNWRVFRTDSCRVETPYTSKLHTTTVISAKACFFPQRTISQQAADNLKENVRHFLWISNDKMHT